MLFIDNSSSRILDWHISSNCSILLTRYATSCVGEVVAFVSHYSKSPKGSVNWYSELLYTCNEIISEFKCFTFFMDEIVIRKNLWMGLNSRSDIKRCCFFWSSLYWWTCLIEKLYTFPDSGFRCFHS